MTKPFNLADAKLGHPVALQATEGIEKIKVRLYDFEMKVEEHTSVILGVVDFGNGVSTVYMWMQDGEPWYKADIHHPGCLVMAPLGTVDGREVYPGDMLLNTVEDLVPVPYGVPFDPGMWSWPAPKRVYPVTHMSTPDLNAAWHALPGHEGGHTMVANAAIRHGIDNGYLIDPTLLDKLAVAIDDTASTPELFVDLVVKRLASLDAQVAEQARTIAEMRMREVVIASHFYDKGTSNEFSRVSINRTRMEYIAAELTKVK